MRDKKDILLQLLLLRCKQGDRQALLELVSQWDRRLFYFIRRLVSQEDDAWDVLQQTWIKVLKGIGKVEDPRQFPVWLYLIARRTAANHWRGYYREQSHMAESPDMASIADTEDNWPHEYAEEVHIGLGRISIAHREVLTLYFMKDLTMEQMAEVLAVPVGTIKSRLSYAKRALRAVLEEKEKHQ